MPLSLPRRGPVTPDRTRAPRRWAGLWTVTSPPVELQGELAAAWELDQGPVSRWHLPVRTDARVFADASRRHHDELVLGAQLGHGPG